MAYIPSNIPTCVWLLLELLGEVAYIISDPKDHSFEFVCGVGGVGEW